jgi:hypothetical protein
MRKFVYIIFVIILAIVSYCWYIGLFSGVTVSERQEGGYYLVGKDFKGAYSGAGKFMEGVCNSLKESGIGASKGFGIYYDDPKSVKAEECRSYLGQILEAKDLGKIAELQAKGYRIDSVQKKNSMVINFPVKSKASYMVGPMKAYPAFSKYAAEKGYKPTLSMEIYDEGGKEIVFVMQVE